VDPLGGGEPVESRHVDVEHRHVRPQRHGEAHGLVAAAGLGHDPTATAAMTLVLTTGAVIGRIMTVMPGGDPTGSTAG
jgi:hypothetical protein